MPTKSSKSRASEETPKTATKSNPKTETPENQEPTSERQSQFATILIGLLIIVGGLLVYNYFQSNNQPTTTQETKNNNQASNTTPSPTPTPKANNASSNEGSYTVQSGDSVWSVAEKVYGDGFQWKKIADANNLSTDAQGRPVVEVGQKLVVPGSAAVAQKPEPTTIAKASPTPTVTASPTPKPTVLAQKPSTTVQPQETPETAIQTYTVKHGDTLWAIAQAVYGKGSDWILIFNDPHNNLGRLTDGAPLIHAGNELYLPQPQAP